jgi:hypothetical protein
MPDQPDRSAGIECPKFVCAAQPTVCSESSIIEGRITSNLTEPHGLRKAAGRLLAKAGATAKRIMSVLGHTTLAEAEHYTEEADQAGLAEDAVIKLEGHKANRIAQTISVGLGKTPKTRGKSDRKE